MSSTTKTVIWVLFGAWAIALVVFLAKFHNFVDHPVGHSNGGGGGIFLAISQAALAVVVLLTWRLQKNA